MAENKSKGLSGVSNHPFSGAQQTRTFKMILPKHLNGQDIVNDVHQALPSHFIQGLELFCWALDESVPS